MVSRDARRLYFLANNPAKIAEARINTPSTQGANWQWRLTQPLTPALSAHIAELTALYHRVPGEEL